jgi:hypothetical protein
MLLAPEIPVQGELGQMVGLLLHGEGFREGCLGDLSADPLLGRRDGAFLIIVAEFTDAFWLFIVSVCIEASMWQPDLGFDRRMVV